MSGSNVPGRLEGPDGTTVCRWAQKEDELDTSTVSPKKQVISVK